jgi:hypothetical protein
MKTTVVTFVALSLCLVGTTSAQMAGIKVIKPSSFDPADKTVSLTFINDDPNDITALAYCIDVQNKPSSTVQHSGCVTEELLPAVVENSIKYQGRSISAGPHFVRPGQERVLHNSYTGMEDVAGAHIEVVFVAFSDGTTQSADGRADFDLRVITQTRATALRQNLAILAHAEAVLQDASDAHPAATLLNRLSADSMTKGSQVMDRLKVGGGTDERDYIQKFVAEQQYRVNELSKHQIKARGQQ